MRFRAILPDIGMMEEADNMEDVERNARLFNMVWHCVYGGQKDDSCLYVHAHINKGAGDESIC